MFKRARMGFWEKIYECFVFAAACAVWRVNKIKADSPITLAHTKGPLGRDFQFMLSLTVYNVSEIKKCKTEKEEK